MAEVLITGASGGREIALFQAMEASPEVTRVEVTSDIQEGLDLFRGGEKPFVIIGPEAPLVDGASDELRGEGYTVFGVGEDAAQYEASKSRTVRLARSSGVTHPQTYIAEGASMADDAYRYVASNDPSGFVIKADGLAGGKGVYLSDDRGSAMRTTQGLISGELADGAGKEVINFAQRRSGPEVSAMVLVGSGHGDHLILPLSQDHKRLKNNDEGPNTGGMGAYAPVPQSVVDASQFEKIDEMADKLLAGMTAEDVQYMGGVMYLGLMMDEELEFDPTLIEINVRFGDPETQVVLPLLIHAGVDSYRLLRSAAEGEIEKPNIDCRI